MTIKVDEAQVEDALATYPAILAELLRAKGEVSLLLRQHPLPSGRLDLLCTEQDKLLLIELKVERFQSSFLQQVLNYRTDLLAMQSQGLLLRAPLSSYLLCPSFSASQADQCQVAGVMLVAYSPERVLTEFFDRLQSIARFVSIKPADHGLWGIHLIHRVLSAMPHEASLAGLAKSVGLSPKTVGNYLRFAQQLALVEQRNGLWALSGLGSQYVAQMEGQPDRTTLSAGQRQLLRDSIIKDPFSSSVVFGIYTIVECAFTLARNSYPVTTSQLMPYFRSTCGKELEWTSARSLGYGVRMYSNYAMELGLLGKSGNRLLLTPDGIRFVLLLQLHKGIAMAEAMTTRRGGPDDGY